MKVISGIWLFLIIEEWIISIHLFSMIIVELSLGREFEFDICNSFSKYIDTLSEGGEIVTHFFHSFHKSVELVVNILWSTVVNRTSFFGTVLEVSIGSVG